MRRVGPNDPSLTGNMAGERQHSHRGPGERITHSLRRRKRGPDRSAINPFVKYTLFFLNFIFLIVGLLLLVMGAYILDLKGKTVTSFIDFIFDPACLFCLGGCIITLISFFGCFGALRENIIFLRVYYVLMSIFLLIEIILVILVFVFYFVEDAFSNLGLYPEDTLKDAVVRYRDDEDMQSFIDNIQDLLSCCGVSNDDEGYKDWNLNEYFNCTDKNRSPQACDVPFSCCKISEGDNINYRCGAKMLSDNTTDRSAIHTQGCLKGLQVVITDNIWIVGGIIIGVLIPQAFFICFAKALVSQIQEQKMKW